MLSATCHCGRVRLTVPEPPSYRNECHCTVCYKYGAIWGYYPKTDVVITIDSSDMPATDPAFSTTTPLPGLAYYIREDTTVATGSPSVSPRGHLAFACCAHCGCMTHWVGVKPDYAENPKQRVGINTRLMVQAELAGVAPTVTEGPRK
ncbi:MAG: hypothetical protein SEPTF4163_004383 [Sporothrix epigloea]